jgi:hypothetical protein
MADLRRMSPEREARLSRVLEVSRLADRVIAGLEYPRYANGTSPNHGRRLRALRLGYLTLNLLCRPVHRRRFEKRLRAYRQELSHLEKYAPSDD